MPRRESGGSHLTSADKRVAWGVPATRKRVVDGKHMTTAHTTILARNATSVPAKHHGHAAEGAGKVRIAPHNHSLWLTPTRVPLNDDRQEKADRRHALHEQQRNSFRSSGTPGRRRISLAAGQNSPHTPAQDVDMPDVAGTAVTPMKRVMPLLANFEEWMKMATDNVRITLLSFAMNSF